jgi:HemY protein
MRAPSDPAWTADGIVTDRWMPVSPVSGRLDAFQWKVPLAEIAAERRDIEPDVIESTDLSAPLPGGEGAAPGEAQRSRVGGAAANEVKPKSESSSAAKPRAEIPAPEPAAPGEAQRSRAALPSPPPPAGLRPAKQSEAAPRAEAVIPLIHVPDDPGPDPSPDTDPEPGSAGVPRGLRLF